MRIRSTKPEFWRSERITRVSWDARLVLKGLESYVDDNGVGRDDLALIVGDLFQRDLVREPSRTLARVSEAISDLCEAGLLWRYEDDGTALLYLSFWEQIQRVDKPQPGRFPRPDGSLNYKDSVIRESVANVRESSRGLAPGTGEQGNRGTGEQGTKDLAPAAAPAVTEPDHFEDFWTEYPRKAGKTAARKAWPRAVKAMKPTDDLTSAERLVAAARYWAGLWRDAGTDTQFIPHPATWLNGKRWDDQPPTQKLRAVSGGYLPFQNPTDQSVYDEPLG